MPPGTINTLATTTEGHQLSLPPSKSMHAQATIWEPPISCDSILVLQPVSTGNIHTANSIQMMSPTLGIVECLIITTEDRSYQLSL